MASKVLQGGSRDYHPTTTQTAFHNRGKKPYAAVRTGRELDWCTWEWNIGLDFATGGMGIGGNDLGRENGQN